MFYNQIVNGNKTQKKVYYTDASVIFNYSIRKAIVRIKSIKVHNPTTKLIKKKKPLKTTNVFVPIPFMSSLHQ